MVTSLEKHRKINKRKGPVVLVIMDGVGYGKYRDGDAFINALTPNIDRLTGICPSTRLKAHGRAVGLPSDADMGNSEVGHNAMGCGKVHDQGAKLVSGAIASGKIFEGRVWKKLISNAREKNTTLHFIGLFSDGNVHSHIDHLKGMLERAMSDAVKKIRIHILLDGRDVGETSALDYIDPFEDYLKGINKNGVDFMIASGGGRMVITMDRYGANWDMVKKGWETHVLGEGRRFPTAHEAVKTYRAEASPIDQDLPPFVIEKDGKPAGTIEDGDSVIFYNFRGDRALEITAAFENKDFDKFDRKRYPEVEYAGMMEYDGDIHVPKQYLVNPPFIEETMGEYLVASGVRTLAISETQKFGHVTYFFNGNRTGKFSEELEEYVEILSDVLPFEQRPWMKCASITDRVLEEIEKGNYDFIRLNYPNGDMVGHTGVYPAVVCSMEALDLCIGRLEKAVRAKGGILILTADHGNADDMFEHKKSGDLVKKDNGTPKAKTSHSLNPVPCIIYDPEFGGEYKRELKEGLGISSIAATCIELLGYAPPRDYDESVLVFGD